MKEDNTQYTNALINENSPYLLQHAHNPVEWYPWGAEALEKAARENKPLLISIGYSACHWCHVMERESFTDEGIAAFMNKNFVNIKVDREERPDIDQIYMNAVQLITRSGGWPLNAFALPDGRPFYAGTYFPPSKWRNVLAQLSKIYVNEYDKVLESAESVTEGIRKSEWVEWNPEETQFSAKEYASFFEGYERDLDFDQGGFGGAPKFPLPAGLSALLKNSYYTGNERALNFVELTLKKMAFGGIYDQLGGGFSRYAVDEAWIIPHFEKMLYDNAQLLTVYSEAYLLRPDPIFKEVIAGVVRFLKSEIRHGSGGFYSALDADSEGVEGKYYVFTDRELSGLLTVEEYQLARDYYNLTSGGNWEKGFNILHRKLSEDGVGERLGMSEDEVRAGIEEVKKKLLGLRSQRIRPGLDDKILSAWNGMAIVGLVDAYRSVGEDSYLSIASDTAAFLTEKMMDSVGVLYRNFKNGERSIPGFLDDYAFAIKGLSHLYQATGVEKWLSAAGRLMEYAIGNFKDPESGMFFYTSSESEPLIARKMELMDNVIPSSNSLMGQNLFVLGKILDRPEWVKFAEQMVSNMAEKIKSGGPYTAVWGDLYARFAFPQSEVVVTGPEAVEKVRELAGNFLPNAVFLPAEEESELELVKGRFDKSRTRIFVCVEKSCKLPVEAADEALKQLKIDPK
nr:thioredoxin domain-containing protein [Saprospiraceae bacterium]